MQNMFNTPQEVIRDNIQGGTGKASMPLGKMILMAMMAGAFIAIGGAASNTAVHAIDNVGLARTLAGTIFPVGLMMIIICGGELFTGNCLIFMAVLDKKTTLVKMLRNLVVVYLGNFAGALIIDTLVYYSGNLDYTAGRLGAYSIKIALTKVQIDPVKAVCSGILCNMLVCMAVLMAGAAKDIGGKIAAIAFPIFAFVVAGFEHCVANMFYIPIGIMAAGNETYAAKAAEVYGITAEQLGSLTPLSMLSNLIPVTIGNIIGGVVFIGTMYYLIHIKEWQKPEKNTK
jgi:formate/nitrite transporter